MRDVAVPPGPKQLARRLADASQYPEIEDFDLLERTDEWLDGLLLKRVCQHFLSNEEIQHELFGLIEEAFGRCQPPPPLAPNGFSGDSH